MESRTRIVPPEMKDLPRLVEIERSCFPNPWSPKEFVRVLHIRRVSCVVLIESFRVGGLLRAKFVEKITGFVVYWTDKDVILLRNLAVDPPFWRRGVATKLVDWLKDRVRRRGTLKRIELLLSEYNLSGQLFFCSRGFRAVETLHHYHGPGHDAYRMIWLPGDLIPQNRMFGGFHAANF